MKIIPHLKAITNLISQNLITQIEAETGTGKSIMIPGTLALEKEYVVYVSVPRVTSAITLAEFERKTFPSLSIGYGADGNKKYDDKTKVVYATAGHLRRKLFSYFREASQNGFLFCDVLIMDEIHVGSVDNSVIMSLWDFARKRGLKVPKLVLLSATPTDSFLTPEAEIYHIDVERPYPVNIVYHDVYSNPSETTTVYNHATNIIANLDKSKGNVLVFAHGSSIVEDMIRSLEKKLDPAENFIIGAYSAMKSEDIDRIYKPSPNGERKIIIATNIAESSITIDGLGVVIDTLFENRAFTSGTGGLRLNTVHIAKDSARQRLGRTGRTRSGECHRIMSEDAYNHLEDHVDLEIKRVPIHEVVMEFISVNMNPLELIHDIDPNKISESIELLTELEAISSNGVTQLGHFLPSVPLGVRNGAFLYRWIQAGYPTFPGIVVASIIDVYSTPGYFYLPQRNRNEKPYEYSDRLVKHFKEHVSQFMGKNILNTYLNVWIEFSKVLSKDLFHVVKYGAFNSRQYSRFRDFAEDSSLNIRKWKDLLSIIRQVNNTIYHLPREGIRGKREIGSFDPDNVTDKAMEILTQIYRGQRLHRNFGNKYIHEKTMIMHTLDTRNPISEMETGELPEYIICIDSAEIKGRHFVGFALPYQLTHEEKEEIKRKVEIENEKFRKMMESFKRLDTPSGSESTFHILGYPNPEYYELNKVRISEKDINQLLSSPEFSESDEESD